MKEGKRSLLTTKEKCDIKRLYIDGMKPKKIATKFRIPIHRVYYHIRKDIFLQADKFFTRRVPGKLW